MNYFFDLAAEGSKQAKQIKAQTFEGRLGIEKANTQKVIEQGRNRFLNTKNRIMAKIGDKTNLGIKLTDPQKLETSIRDTYKKVDSMFGGKLDADGQRVLKIAMHELMSTTNVEWEFFAKDQSNIYYWPEITDGGNTDMSKYKSYQIIEGILQHIPEKPTSKLSIEAISNFRKDLNKLLKKDNKIISKDGNSVVDFDMVLNNKAKEPVSGPSFIPRRDTFPSR